MLVAAKIEVIHSTLNKRFLGDLSTQSHKIRRVCRLWILHRANPINGSGIVESTQVVDHIPHHEPLDELVLWIMGSLYSLTSVSIQTTHRRGLPM